MMRPIQKKRDGAPLFHRYVGIDYSGAKTPTASVAGLRIYLADRQHKPKEILPPPSLRPY